MEEKLNIDMAGKVILSLDEFMKINNELTILREEKDKKYNALIDYLLNQCELVHYTNDTYSLKYDTYHNRISEYLEQTEPEKYREYIELLLKRKDN